MTEAKFSNEQAITSLREKLGQDGHPIENATSLIVEQTATVRDLYGSSIDATFGLVDALAGESSKVPQKIVDRLTTLAQVLGNNQLAQDAQSAAIFSSPNQRRELTEASKKGFSALREVALRMTIPAKAGEQPVTLADKIRTVPTPK